MTASPRLGPKIKALRRREGLTQARMADALGISASYLNLIEHNRRPLTAPLLIKIAQRFELDLAAFGHENALLSADLHEVFGDPIFDEHGLTSEDVRDLASSQPALGRAVLNLYRRYQDTREHFETLSERLEDAGTPRANPEFDHPGLPSEEVTDMLQAHLNHFPALEDAAEALWADAELDTHAMFGGLRRHLEKRLGVNVRILATGTDAASIRRFDPERRQLTLSETLRPRSRNFQLAHQIALVEHSAILDKIVHKAHLTTEGSRQLARVVLANYFAGAVLMPYERFLKAAEAMRYDMELLGHRFRTSFEQVAHRLTTLQRPGQKGIGFHLVRVDIAGNISKRFSATGIRFARYSGSCARWTVHQAFLSPGSICTQVSRMTDGQGYFCIARTVRQGGRGYHSHRTVYAIGLGCRVEDARRTVYAEGVDLDNLDAAVPIGTTCRLCDRQDCEQRAVPSLRTPLKIDENRRGLAFYVTGEDEL